MAKIAYMLGVAGIRGTAGGTTYSGNKAGSYVKPYARGPSSGLPAQALSRVSMAGLAYVWRTMADWQRDAWNVFAATPPETDIDSLGMPVSLSGYQWFQRCNARLIITTSGFWGAPGSTTPQVPTSPFSLELYSLETGLTACWAHTVAADWLLSGTGELFGSLERSPGVLQAQGGWRFLHTFYFGDPGDCDISVDLMRVFGNVPAGFVLHARLYRQSIEGIRSTPEVATGVFA